MSFRLISYRDKTLDIQLRDGISKTEGPNITIVIGPNGSGKSIVLSRILEDLDFFHGEITSRKSPKSTRGAIVPESQLDFEIDGHGVTLQREGNRARAFLDGNEVAIHSVKFPRKAIAVAHLPVDRFKFSRAKDGFYAYLGLRQSSNLTTTGALELKVAAAFLSSTEKPGFRTYVQEWLHNLGLGRDVFIALDGIDPELFREAMNSVGRFYDRAYNLSQRRMGRYRALLQRILLCGKERW